MKADDIVVRLTEILGSQGVLVDAFDIQPFVEDWRGAEKGAAICVALPKSTQEVSDVVKLANELNFPIFPQGGNTGLCYGAVPSGTGNGVVVGLTRMRKVRSIDKVSNSIVVDAGIVLENVHRAAEAIERSFPLHLGSEGTAQVGGLIATNAGGTNALRYGTMRDLVFGLECVLPNGEIVTDLAPLRKNNTGYDLRHLLAGAEGTLGIVTAATLKLHPANKSEAHAWLSFAKPSHAVDLLVKLQDRFDTSIIAYELLSKSQVDLVLKHIERTRIPYPKTPEWNVLIELGTPNATANLKADLEEFLAEQFDECYILDAVIAQNAAQAEDFWHTRHSISEANKLEGKGLTHDIAVAISDVPAYITSAEAMLSEMFPDSFPVVACHLGDGNIHYIAMFSREIWESTPDHQQVIADLQTRLHDLAIGLGGTFSAEHGIGRKLRGELARLVSPAKYTILCSIKQAIDPQNIMNPGILLLEERLLQTSAI